MELRSSMVLVVVSVMFVVNAVLLIQEHRKGQITPIQVLDEHTEDDPLQDISYNALERADNFTSFGLQGAMREQTIQVASDYWAEHQERIQTLLAQSPDYADLARSICPDSPAPRPRYAILGYLVRQRGDELRPVSLDTLDAFEQGQWVSTSQIRTVYEVVELNGDPKPNATLMGIAAILTQNEATVRRGKTPWGTEMLERWDWNRVKGLRPGLERDLVQIFALMHLFLEAAWAEGGICSGSE